MARAARTTHVHKVSERTAAKRVPEPQGKVRGQRHNQDHDLHLKRRIVQVARGVGEKQRGAGEEHHRETGMGPGFEVPRVGEPQTQSAQVRQDDRSHESRQTDHVDRLDDGKEPGVFEGH